MVDPGLKSTILAALSQRPDFPFSEKRIAVVHEIFRNPDFGDAEYIWLAVRETHGISRTTVYKTIIALLELGFIQREKAGSFGYKYYLNRYDDRICL